MCVKNETTCACRLFTSLLSSPWISRFHSTIFNVRRHNSESSSLWMYCQLSTKDISKAYSAQKRNVYVIFNFFLPAQQMWNFLLYFTESFSPSNSIFASLFFNDYANLRRFYLLTRIWINFIRVRLPRIDNGCCASDGILEFFYWFEFRFEENWISPTPKKWRKIKWIRSIEIRRLGDDGWNLRRGEKIAGHRNSHIKFKTFIFIFSSRVPIEPSIPQYHVMLLSSQFLCYHIILWKKKKWKIVWWQYKKKWQKVLIAYDAHTSVYVRSIERIWNPENNFQFTTKCCHVVMELIETGTHICHYGEFV